MKKKITEAVIFILSAIITIIIGKIYNWMEKILNSYFVKSLTKFEIALVLIPLIILCVLWIYWKYKEYKIDKKEIEILKTQIPDIITMHKLIREVIIPIIDTETLYVILDNLVFTNNRQFIIPELDKFILDKEIIKKLKKKYHLTEIKKQSKNESTTT